MRRATRWLVGALGLVLLAALMVAPGWSPAGPRAAPAPPAAVISLATPSRPPLAPYPPPSASRAAPVRPPDRPRPTFTASATHTPWTTTPEPSPTATWPPGPLPTPAFLPAPAGTPSGRLQRLLYAYWPRSQAPPQLRAALLDAQGAHWGQAPLSIDLGLAPGWKHWLNRSLCSAFPAPDGRSAIVDICWAENGHELDWVDLTSGTVRPMLADERARPGFFFAWAAGSRRILTGSGLLLDLQTQTGQVIDYGDLSSRGAQLMAAAFSPQGDALVDATVYYRSVTRPEPAVEIGLRPPGPGPRVALARLPGETVVSHSLAWSPDGRQVAAVVGQNLLYDAPSGSEDVQLWLIERTTGRTRLLARGLALHPARWSPNGHSIAFLAAESPVRHYPVYANVYVVDVATGAQRQVTRFSSRVIEQVEWSPDGGRIGFGLSFGAYAEIWAAPLDGTEPYPVAGPAALPGVFMWLP